jgi:hypothetical protein
MFCQFAEDTGIFPIESFLRLIEDRTEKDGSDLGSWLIHLFQVLNTPEDKRQNNLDEDLAAFPYVNGQLFANPIHIPSFDTEMREALLQCTYFNWTKVSPALFGSLFQTVMLPAAQRQGGAHYTSEKNILKVIQPLFLDELREEFERIKALKVGKKQKFEQLHDKLAKLTFFDPACGCGNFLILGFRELRELELDILEELYPSENRQTVLDVGGLSKIGVDQFYGIEIEEFPARIAEAAMWLVDHQMNMKLSESFGQAFLRLPLTESAHIYHGNALTTNWADILPPKKCSYILGNPPFLGKKEQTFQQKNELYEVFERVKSNGVLDYVACWFLKAAKYIQGTAIKVAFVSTKSIVQGEQVSILWNEMYQHNCKIFFAHRTFKWTIDEKKTREMRIAAVHVVIVGFSTQIVNDKYLFEYESPKSDPHKLKAKTINAYLVDAPEVIVSKRMHPLSNVPEMIFGTKLVDDGHLVLSEQEKVELETKYPQISEYIRLLVGAEEFINSKKRWCLWLTNADPAIIRTCSPVLERIEKVRQFRLASKKSPTVKMAQTPSLFGEIRQPETDYLLVPKVSSENRNYVPLGFLTSDVIASGSSLVVPDATFFHFGVLSSSMHMAWMRHVAGRLKSDYQYSNTIVYNNFPWPETNDKDKEDISEKAQAVLDARKQFPDSSLADLYDPNTMPPVLLKAHQALDKAVDKAYRKAAFKDEKERIEFLFDRYQKLTAPLIEPEKKKQRRKG